MAASFAMHTVRTHIEKQQKLEEQKLTASTQSPRLECTCGALAFREKHSQDRQRLLKRVAPIGSQQTTAASTKDDALDMEKQKRNQREDEPSPVPRKRSLWRKMLGKGPKCICEKLQRERDARRPKPISIPSEYAGCVTVRVAGKKVAYTREMQLINRRSYTPMDAISEDED